MWDSGGPINDTDLSLRFWSQGRDRPEQIDRWGEKRKSALLLIYMALKVGQISNIPPEFKR